MKLNDIYINKEKSLNLKKDKRILLVDENIKETLNLDSINKNLHKINLKEIIKKQKKLVA
jgi:hypothetical protein